MTKSKELQNLINDLHAFRISSPTTFCHPSILDDAAQVIENLLQELEEERNRHDRLQDWTVARDEELADCPLPAMRLLFGGGQSETE